MTDLARTAIHEAGHACGLWILRFPIGLVSLRRGRSHLGATFGAESEDATRLKALVDGRHPLDGLDPEARRYADRLMVYTAMGDQAADLLGPRIPGYRSDPPIHELPEPDLEPALASRLAAAEADPDGWPDDELLFAQAYGVVGVTANAYLAWIRAEARRIATDHTAAILGLAAALLASETHVLDGRQVSEVLEAHERSKP